jgi:ribosomal protein L11 methyltransferase
MPYTSVTFDADADIADAWADALLAAGALSVDVADPHAGTGAETPLFAEPGEPVATAWPVSRLTALFVAGTDVAAVVAQCTRTAGLARPAFETGTVPEQDWVRATQAQFGPIAVGSRLWIVPTWSEPPVADACVLRLDPGLAFGTGSHPTTRLCLEWLTARVRGGETVLDYGCGSGILAIAAMLLGAGSATGTDIDPQAVGAARANATANGAAATFVEPDALAPGTFDIVVANILANPLVLLAPALAARTRPGGAIALAGILDVQADAVAAAYAPWFKLAAWRRAEGWVLLEGERLAVPSR